MKILFLILSVFIATNGIGQKKKKSYNILNEKEGKIYYSEVVSVALSKQDILKKAKKWLIEEYKNKEVIQLEDTTSGELSGTGVYFVEYYKSTISVYYTIKIFAKDGKYKCEIINISGQARQRAGGSGVFYKGDKTAPFIISNEIFDPFTGNYYKRLLKQLDNTFKNTLENLKKYITKPDEDF